jgi:DNA-binding CsgD family transcriptional regulator
MKYYTDNELIQESKSNLQLIEKGILQKKYSLEEISDIIPGILHVNSLQDFAILFLNKYGEKRFGLSQDEIIAKGSKFIEEIFEPGTIDYFSKPLIQMIQEDDRSRVISFFQKVKPYGSSKFEWLLTTSKFLSDGNESISISQGLSEMHGPISAISKVLDDNLYIRKNMQRFGSLTKREKQILKLVALGYSTNQVAKELFLSPQTVKTHRKNISKKLNLERTIDWEYFANAFDL